jgi:hypothetical protein
VVKINKNNFRDDCWETQIIEWLFAAFHCESNRTPCQPHHMVIVYVKNNSGSFPFYDRAPNKNEHVETRFFFFFKNKKGSRLTFAVQDGNVIGGQSRLGLDTDQQGTSTSGSNAFSWEMNALETQ